MSTTPLRISSLANFRVKRALRARKRAHREEERILLIEGVREIRRALDNAVPVRELYYCPSLLADRHASRELVERCRERGVDLFECEVSVLRKMAYREHPEGLVAVASAFRRDLASLQAPPHALLLVAETVEKPGNLGTLTRSADAAGAHAILVCDRRTDIDNPNVIRGSIGLVFAMPVVETPSRDAVDWLQRNGIRIVAASPRAEALYTDVDLTGSVALVVGSEQDGLSRTWIDAAGTLVRIPMHGQGDSLNVAAAATVLLFEAARQRNSKTARR